MSKNEAPARSPVAAVEAAVKPIKFVEVEVLRKIGLEYVPNGDGEMVRVTSEVAVTAQPGDIVKITDKAAAKLLGVGAVRPTAHTFD